MTAAFGDSRLPERFWSKVDQADNGCWHWTAATNGVGYGKYSINKRLFYAHRVAYVVLVGPIPGGLVLDHLCRVRHCVNPDHLEPVTQRENIIRGVSFFAIRAAQAHCVNGHPFDEANTMIVGNGTRKCRACCLARTRRYRAEKRARLAGAA